MYPVDAFWHLLNFLLPAAGVAGLGAAMVKLVWRSQLQRVAWRRLAAYGLAPALVISALGLWFFGRDGKMATYAALVVASAAGMWWAAWGPGKPR